MIDLYRSFMNFSESYTWDIDQVHTYVGTCKDFLNNLNAFQYFLTHSMSIHVYLGRCCGQIFPHHQISVFIKYVIFRPKLARVAENCYHNIGSWSFQHIVSYAIMQNRLCTLPKANNLWKILHVEPKE
jgi:hypothetical protein